MNKKIILSSAIMLIMAHNPIYAEDTPNGMNPANEGLCDQMADNYPDLTKGLYGLCVAYCEARDFPEDISDVDRWEKGQTAGKRILARYNQKKTDFDPDMPCTTTGSCPAWTTEQLASIGDRNYSIIQDDYVRRDTPSIYQFVEGNMVGDADFPADSFAHRARGGTTAWINQYKRGTDDESDDAYYAGFRDFESHYVLTTESWETNTFTPAVYMEVSKTQFDICKQEMIDNTI